MQKQTMAHGGDLNEFERLYGVSKDEITNYSGNVNPLGVPQSVKSAIIQNVDRLSEYPDVSYVALRGSIAAYTKADPSHICVGNGSTELIALYVKSLRREMKERNKAVVISPAYSEYEREIERFGLETVIFPLTEGEEFTLDLSGLFAVLDQSVLTLIVCNPNNPTASAVKNDQMRSVLTHCQKTGISVMVDETYAEFAESDDVSAVPLVKDFENLFVIRGVSKFFALPGIRLGYGICSNQATLAAINSGKDPWSVGVVAEIAGSVMFTDQVYIRETMELVRIERNRMYAALKGFRNAKVFESNSNFFLLKLLDGCKKTSGEIHEELIKKHMLIRDCNGYSFLDARYLRFCIMSPSKNDLLLKELENLIESRN